MYLLIKLLFLILTASVCAMENKIHKHPLMKETNLETLYTIAQDLSKTIDQQFSELNKTIVSLGQSPAYLTKMMQLLEKKSDRSYIYLAFSGSYYYGNEIDKERLSMFEKLQPLYASYLQKIGLSENDLNAQNSRFIIIELCYGGQGIRSFLSLIEKYRTKPSVVYLQLEDMDPVSLSVPNVRFGLNKPREKLMRALATADHYNDRLVPKFDVKNWEKVNPLDFKPEENSAMLLERLATFVTTKSHVSSKQEETKG